ncbi:response regulator [Actinoplanes sp. NPDC049118]|uniref:response regulator n=1 Tax=Actinoplanes sp. NPDC049118 TaxID=3155769 RepID=UPI0033E077C6
MANIAAADDDANVQYVKRVLVKAGHQVSTYDDGAALVEEVRAHHPDVVVTDNEMPVMTGLEAVQALHDDPATADIPAVLVSGVAASLRGEVRRVVLRVQGCWIRVVRLLVDVVDVVGARVRDGPGRRRKPVSTLSATRAALSAARSAGVGISGCGAGSVKDAESRQLALDDRRSLSRRCQEGRAA